MYAGLWCGFLPFAWEHSNAVAKQEKKKCTQEVRNLHILRLFNQLLTVWILEAVCVLAPNCAKEYYYCYNTLYFTVSILKRYATVVFVSIPLKLLTNMNMCVVGSPGFLNKTVKVQSKYTSSLVNLHEQGWRRK